MKAECTTTVRHTRIVFQENRSKLTLVNPGRNSVRRVIVDNCQITDGIRCDHYCDNSEMEHYIELKGQDIEHAVNQIDRTIRELSRDSRNFPKISFVICTRSPLSSAKIQVLRAKFKKNYNSDLIVKSSPYEYTI